MLSEYLWFFFFRSSGVFGKPARSKNLRPSTGRVENMVPPPTVHFRNLFVFSNLWYRQNGITPQHLVQHCTKQSIGMTGFEMYIE